MCRILRIISAPFIWLWCLLNFLRKFIFNALFLIFIILFIYSQTYQATPIKGALIVDLVGSIIDKPITNQKVYRLNRKLFGNSTNRLQENSLFDIVSSIRQAKEDMNIQGLVLLLKDFSGGSLSSLEYIGKALREFRDNGKPIYAVGDSYSQAQYYLASYANKIYLTPLGGVDIHGITTNNFYYKTLLKKLGISTHVFRVGTYKSAVEPFLRDNMSDNARKADTRWVHQLWKNYLTVVAANRKTTIEKFFPDIQIMLNNLRKVGGNTAQFALNNKWVDEVAYRGKIDAALVQKFGWNKQEKTFNGISIYDYPPITSTSKKQNNQIAVIFANGTIINGSKKNSRSVESNAILNQIRFARLDPNIKAIIFRINSPGGSLNAAEMIRSELAAAHAEGKPIVISMGGVAASGGYWVSTPADYIIASASTLTGSIGVFWIVNTLEKSLDIIGIHADGVSTSPLANVSFTKALPKEFSQMIQLSIKNSYRDFIAMVSQSRNKTFKEVDQIAQGRVWIGTDAVQNGLVDQLGDFDDAVNKAANLAQLKQYQLYWYLDDFHFLELLPPWTNALALNLVRLFLPTSIIEIMDELNVRDKLNYNWNDPEHRYAICFSCKQFL
ncbi:signal peptide peptidase SppA [Sodalis sp. CWE]|nr:signal peptide peptidase SppA [Sodalis sp. CWE]